MRGWESRSWTGVAAGFALLALAGAAVIAYVAVFSGFSSLDDEGLMLLNLRLFLDGGQLYDEVVSQYGPFYFEAVGAFYGLPGVQVSHDAGRFLTIACWLASAGLSGLVAWRMTRSAALGIVAGALAFSMLQVMQNDPSHPGTLTTLLVALFVASPIVAGDRRRVALPIAGAALGALCLVKVNVGGFALLSALLTLAATTPWSRAWRLAAEVAFVLAPPALMLGKLDEGWAQEYALHVSLAALALVLVLRAVPAANSETGEGAERARLLGIGLAALAAVSVSIVLVLGTSVRGLVEGVLLDPLNHPNVFTVELGLPWWALALDVLSLAAAVAVTARRATVRPWLSGAGRVASGLALWAATAGLPDEPNHALWALPLAWVAALPPRGSAWPGAFSRTLLTSVAVLQALHAYPVAGGQRGYAAFLLAPVGAVCIADGLAVLREAGLGGRARALVPAAVAVAAAALLWTGPADLARDQWDDYRDGESLRLFGSTKIRVPAEQARVLEEFTQLVGGRCGTWVSMPGLGSFHLWTGKAPPVEAFGTDWMRVLDSEEQQRVVDAAEARGDVCALVHNDGIVLWNSGRPTPQRPLVRYISERFYPVEARGPYVLYLRAPPRSAEPRG